MDIIGVGDNVIDKYVNLRRVYPGGNALNIAVLCRRLGLITGYVGVTGTDRFGKHIRDVLVIEDVDTARLKVREGVNRYAEIELVDGDRRFIGRDFGISFPFILDEADFNYLSGAKVVHTSIYSGIEDQLPHIREVVKCLSFDYSNRWDITYLTETLPFVSCAFLSSSGYQKSEVRQAKKLADVFKLDFMVITMGEHGAVALIDGKEHHQPSVPVKVVDTLGAGDAFISSLLASKVEGRVISQSLQSAAEYSAMVCQHHGAFGRGLEY